MTALSRQLGLFKRDGDSEALGRPYVPMLLAKRGERLALERISDDTRDAITPFVRVVPPELRGRAEQDPAPVELARLVPAAGERVIYLDAVGSPRRQRQIAPLSASYMREIYDAAVASSLAFAPVYPFRRRDLADTVARFASDSIGAAILVGPDTDVTWGSARLKDQLRAEIQALNIDPLRLDVVIDLGYLPPSSEGHMSTVWLVREVTAALPWRSVTLGATSVPDSVSDDIPGGSINGIERREVALFNAVQVEVGAPLRFGDYAVQHPVPPKPGPVPKMRASIRYTTGDFMFVSRGERPLGEIDDVPGEYREVADRLRSHPPFEGSHCCWGDEFIEDIAEGRKTAASQYWMRAVATCHHLTVVARERARAIREAPMERKTSVQDKRASSRSRNSR